MVQLLMMSSKRNTIFSIDFTYKATFRDIINHVALAFLAIMHIFPFSCLSVVIMSRRWISCEN